MNVDFEIAFDILQELEGGKSGLDSIYNLSMEKEHETGNLENIRISICTRSGLLNLMHNRRDYGKEAIPS